MTRDEVLDEALKAIGPEVNWCGCTGALQALKQKAPEKSPELTLESNPYDTNTMSHAELAGLVFDIHRRWMEAQAQYASERDALKRQVEELEGLKPELPPYPPDGEGLSRFGLRWNGPKEPLAVPMPGGYWTPWHLAEAERAQANEWRARLIDAQKDLAKAKAQATEADATADRTLWEVRGAPMKGETP
jgi:hypothetical protein